MGVSVAPEQPGWRSAVMTGQEVPGQAAPAPGLTNAAGEYNCFLNVIVQCLWHCGDFRQQVRMGLRYRSGQGNKPLRVFERRE